MQLITVTVDAPDDILSGYGVGALIRVERDTVAAMSGAQEITTIPVVAGTNQYEYTDPTGSATDYYRTRFSKASPSIATDYSGYSTVFQAGYLKAYATVDQLAASMQLPDQSRYAYLTDLLIRASARIDRECNRTFRQSPLSGTEVRYVDVDQRGRLLDQPDIVSLTTVELGDYTGSTYSAVTAGSTGYYTRQPHGVTSEWPYELVLSDQASTFLRFQSGLSTAKLTGVFGWATVPDLIVEACIDLARERYRQGPGGGGPVGISALGQPIFGGMPESFRRAIEIYKKHDFASYV